MDQQPRHRQPRQCCRGYASATIIDLDEMDRAVLAEAAARRGEKANGPLAEQRAEYFSRQIGAPRARPLREFSTSPDSQRRRNPTPPSDRRRSTRRGSRPVLDQGPRRRIGRKTRRGQNDYQMAARRASGELKRKAVARIHSLQCREPPQLADCGTPPHESGSR